MNQIKVMVNGMPGNMAVNVTKHVMADDRFDLLFYSLTGPEITEAEYQLIYKDNPYPVRLIRPEDKERRIEEIRSKEGAFISVDYTHPSGVNDNAVFYCRHQLPFVMGTTGGNRKGLADTVTSSSVSAVIAPNMAKQIVGFQAMMEYAAETFPALFEGYSLEIKESHQKGKADTSGTAKAMVGYFNQLGVSFSEKDIIMERDPHIQQTAWGVPKEYLGGHGWHTYTLVSEDKSVKFEFTHNINGRDIYAKGTLDAILYLSRKVNEGSRGIVYSMIDVLKKE